MRKAFWIWNIPNCEGGDPLLIAGEALKAGLTDVFVKVADGTLKFGIYNKVDAIPAVVQALKAVGVRVWGWQYLYGNDPAGEERIATARIKELGLDHFIVDAEAVFKKAGWGARAETYLSRLKNNNPGATLAFSSYRFPHYHPEFPWPVPAVVPPSLPPGDNGASERLARIERKILDLEKVLAGLSTVVLELKNILNK